MSAIPQTVVRYDLKASAAALAQNGYEVEDKEVMIVARRSGIEITLYMNGRLMLAPMDDKESARAIGRFVLQPVDRIEGRMS